MKKIFLLLAYLLLVSNFGVSQSDNWKVLSVQREMFSINFLTQEKAWVFAGDFGYKSTDGGLSWSFPIKTNANIGISGGAYFTYPDHIFFIDSLYGWVCQSSEVLLKTSNGGNNWTSINTGINTSHFSCIQFMNRQSGWAAGIYQSKGIILRTNNGGNNWQIVNQNVRWGITSFQMIDSTKGYLSNNEKDTIGFTNDAWNTIQYFKGGNGQRIQRVLFIDSQNGWLLGNPYYVNRTTNGGLNWSIYTNTMSNTANMYFVNPLTGWISVARNQIWKSTNGGINWANQLNLGFHSEEVFGDIYFKNASTGWICSNKGKIFCSTNGGQNWTDMLISPQGNIRVIKLLNANSGLVICNESIHDTMSSIIWKTTNRGYNWVISSLIRDVKVNSAEFIDEQTGYACGDAGYLLKTTNSGINWSVTLNGTRDLTSIEFVDNYTGYVCGSSGSIIKTTNSGINWISQQSNSNKNLNDVYFSGMQTGFIAADSGYILRTGNGGENWNVDFPYNSKNYKTIYFLNPNTGFVAGASHQVTPPNQGSSRVVLKTTNAGINWTLLMSENIPGYCLFNDIIFLNEQTGWIATSNTNVGYVIKSTNGGLNWFQSFGPIGTSSIFGFSGGLYCLNLINENNIWSAGDNGTILTTGPPIGIQSNNSEITDNFSLSQNYPNPFNPKTKIKFDIAQASFTKLVIFDLLGREVATLVNEELKPGRYEADWNASNFSSGVYFYKLISSDFVKTRKMVLMK